jgi:uncharacterized 2Fe-2S/4Fe-4S cluster protein (DUF4445 family)
MSKSNKNQQHEKKLETVDNTINGFPTNENQQYEKTHECAVELWSRGMCMGEVMKKTNMTEDQIAKYREELDKNE